MRNHITMQHLTIHRSEIHHLNALSRHRLLDTPIEELFDGFTKLAAQICLTPVSLITLTNDIRQWFKSNIPLNVTENTSYISFCGQTSLGNELFEISDALEDERFQDNPFVIAEPKIRFYAGIPLITQEGHVLGTLCVMDSTPKHLTHLQRSGLQALGRQVITLIEYHLSLLETKLIIHELADT